MYETVHMQRLWAVGAAAGHSKPVGALLPMPHPSAAAVRAMSVGAASSCALLRTGSCRASGGRGGGDGLTPDPAGVDGAPRSAVAAAGQAPLHFAGRGGDGQMAVAR